MKLTAKETASKFWEVVPAVMRSIFAESRRGAHSLSPNHMRILRMLSVRTCNLSELAEHQDVSLPSMSTTVQTLVERGWLARAESSKDRRVTQLHLTPKGKQVLVEEHKRLVAWMAVRLDTLTANQVAEVERGLQTLLNLFDAPREQASLEETERV
jgi:DNA-binding MarR family transcriptional regulator